MDNIIFKSNKMSSPYINKKEKINIYPNIIRRVPGEFQIFKTKELMSSKPPGATLVHIAIKNNK
jgi:hypothetical protein